VDKFKRTTTEHRCYRLYADSDCVVLPRHFGLTRLGEPVEDQSTTVPLKDFPPFVGELRDYQRRATTNALRHLLRYRGGIVCSPCGTGKTLMALYLASRLRQRTLVVVHKHVLLQQWVDRINQFLPGASVHVVQGTKSLQCAADHQICVAMAQTIIRSSRLPTDYGVLVVDEAHHVPCATFVAVVQRTKTRYRIGLTATPRRADGMIALLHWHMGNVMVRISRGPSNSTSTTYAYHVIRHDAKQLSRPTNFAVVLNDLAVDAARNRKIVQMISTALADSRRILVLSHRLAQVRELQRLLDQPPDQSAFGPPRCGVVIGSTKADERAEALANCRILVASFGVAAEGLDVPELDALVLASPCGGSGTALEQAVGRILRTKWSSKRVVDVSDFNSRAGMLRGMFAGRARYFQRNGFALMR
jgi:superfamily II DNA or RNA helicase